MVNFQIVHDGRASPVVPVYFGFNRPVLSLAAPAFTGMPVWVRVDVPWGKGWLRYALEPQPWIIANGRFEVRFLSREVGPLATLPPAPPPVFGGIIGLPHEPPPQYLRRAPLHLLFDFDRPGTYEARYTTFRYRPRTLERTVDQQSDWTPIEILPSTPEQRINWFRTLTASPPGDTAELLSNYLPSLLAMRDEAALRILARYLDSPEPVIRQYAACALNYFDPSLRERIVPGRAAAAPGALALRLLKTALAALSARLRPPGSTAPVENRTSPPPDCAGKAGCRCYTAGPPHCICDALR
jgi:hypothetical protein